MVRKIFCDKCGKEISDTGEIRVHGLEENHKHFCDKNCLLKLLEAN